MDFKKEIEELVNSLTKADRDYYVLSQPSMSDSQYDALMNRLIKLEAEHPELRMANSPTLRVGNDISNSFEEIKHAIPVLSLDKAYSISEVISFAKKTALFNKNSNPLNFTLEEKIDGLSIVLYYEKGELYKAVTRGNGEVGNDITQNAKTIPTIPLKLTEPITIAVRGEVFINKKDFIKINNTLEEPYSSARNLASGTLRRIKSEDTSLVPLDIFVYEGFENVSLLNSISNKSKKSFSSHAQMLSFLKELGFKTNPHLNTFSLNLNNREDEEKFSKSIYDFIKDKTIEREKLAYEIDGLVLKVDNFAIREQLGFTGHHPRWAIAYKFESPTAKSKILTIDIQIGRTGRITPVAKIAPVKLLGASISSATLHNQAYINTLELAIGDEVEVSRRGDVIPCIEEVLEKNEEGNKTFLIPSECPECKTKLIKKGAHLFCPNENCVGRMLPKFTFFTSTSGMEITGLGESTIRLLIQNGYFKKIEDIYFCDYYNALRETEGFGDKKISAIIKGVNESKKATFSKVLSSLGITDLGKNMASKLIQNGINSIDRLIEISKNNDRDALLSIDGIGSVMATNIISELRDETLLSTIEKLKEAGLNFTAQENEQIEIKGPLNGQSWCVTGSITGFKNPDLAMEEVRKLGARITSGVSGKTTHLLVGEKPGSKLQKAQALGVKLITVEEFLKIINRQN